MSVRITHDPLGENHGNACIITGRGELKDSVKLVIFQSAKENFSFIVKSQNLKLKKTHILLLFLLCEFPFLQSSGKRPTLAQQKKNSVLSNICN